MARRKDYTVVAKTPRYGKSKTKAGNKVRVGTTVTYSDGGKQTLLTPAGKGAKYAEELRSGKCRTNDGTLKVDKDGVVKGLTREQRAYRSGYLSAQKDSAKAFNAVKQVKSAGKSRSKQ